MDRRAFVAASVLLLPGCAAMGLPASPPPERPSRASIRKFGLVGRLALRNGVESFVANIDWHHVADESERLLVMSPLGQGLAELGADRQGAWIDTADHKRYAAATVDDLSEQAFGARLPLSRLPSWVVGRTAGSEVDGVVLDNLGRPTSFVEAGWQVSYPSYESGARDALPLAIRLSRDPLDVRLKVDQWNLLP